MKLISLNAWCGIKYESLKDFLEHYSKEVDIFCFQEIRNGKYLNQQAGPDERENLFKDLINILADFTGHFAEMAPGVGLAVFIRNNINIEKIESREILKHQEIEHLKMRNGRSYYPRILQSIYFKDRNLVIHNFHGLPGSHKKDTPERDLQTKRLLTIMKENSSQMIVGDFNLDVDTEAIEKLSDGKQDLIKEYEIKTTRNSNYSKYETLPFDDYAFLSKDIEVNEFKVLPDEVSDHLALFLDFK